MADLRIVDAPEIPTENITGEEKLPTGGSGNYSISLDSLADYTKTKKDLADNTSVNTKVNGVRQELETHIEDLLNPHQVTKGQIGLGNVDNTADADKPVSNSTQAAIISSVSPKADKNYVDNQLTLKANKADVYTKQESSDLVNNSISTALTPVNSSLNLAKRGIANRYDSLLTYNSGERVVLTNGNIVKSTIDGNTNNPNVNMTGWYLVDKKSSVNTIAELSTIQNPKDGDSVYVKGYYSPENFALLNPYVGGSYRTYVEARKTENDAMFCINGWVLDSYDNAYQVGARAKEGFDNLDIFQEILDKNLPLKLLDGVHEIRYPLVANTSSTILGVGTNSTIIRKTTRNKVTDNPKQSGRVVAFPVIGGGGATYSIDVDAILATAPKDYAANYNYYLRIDSVTFDRELPDDGTNYMVHHNASFTDTGYGQYGWFFPYLCQSTIINSRCFNNEYGIYAINSWMNLFQRVQWRASSGVVFGGLDGDVNRGGTSTNLTDCWVTDVMGGAGHWAWRIHNMDYSFWSSIGTDFVGKEGETPAEGVILVTSGTTGADTTITISGFGSEVVHAKQYLKASGKLTLKGSSWTALDWFNKYGTQSTYLFEATDEAKVSIDLPNFKFMHEVNNLSASYYADQPKFAVASWGSTLEFNDAKVSPKITGKNDAGRFGLQAFQNSTIRVKTRTSDLIAVAGTDDDALENALDHNKFITNQGVQSDSTSVDSGMVAPTACRWDTNQLRLGNQYLWYSPTYDKWLYSTVKPTSETSGSVLGDDALAGSTANRPTTYPLRRTGGCYFDQTIGKPIWWDGSAWKDANGANA